MKSLTWLVVVFGLCESLATSNEPLFPGHLKLNPLTKPLRVLGVFPYNGYSHFLMFQSLMMGLAKRGHNVTVVSPFPLKSPIENYTHIDVSDRFPLETNHMPFEQLAAVYNGDLQSRVGVFTRLSGPKICRDAFTHPRIQDILRQKNQFDIAFTEVFGTTCFAAIGYLLQIPTVSMVTAETIAWMDEYTGESTHPAIRKTHFLRHSDLSTVTARLLNTYYSILSRIIYYQQITRPSEEILREVFGNDVPSLAELRHNVSLVMLNTHPSIFGVRPTVPRALHVGGIHLQPADSRKLPQDIRHWLDTAPSGVLYFSFGSVVSGQSLPARLRNVFMEAFAELKPLRVLWKFDDHGTLSNLSDNVKVAKWVPQVEILSHSNLLAFMAHGGLMGVIEAVYYGVPTVGMPIFGDQRINILALEKRGCAVRLDHDNLTKEDVVKAIITATTDPTMRRRAKEVSREFKDRPMSPLDSAMWWTEYIARHGGAPNLESPTARMPLWQYALLDVLIIAVVSTLIIMILLYVSISCVLRLLSQRRPNRKVSKKE